MTYEEAIEILRDTPIDIRSAREDDIHTLYATAQMMAIEALEKQIPKIPKGDYDSVPHHRCPNCNAAIRVYCDDPYDPACKFCGQALDWSDTE